MGVAHPEARATLRRRGEPQFSFELDGLPPGVDPKGNFDLTFTVVTGERAVEVKTRLD